MSTNFSTLYTQLGYRLNDAGHTRWTLERKKQFVNDAIAHWWDLGGAREVIDETTLTDATSLEYTLPAAITRGSNVLEITVEQAAGEPYATIESASPLLVESSATLPASGTRVKLLLLAPFDVAGRKLRVRYLAPYGSLSADGDLTEVPAEYIYLYAKYLAHAEAAERADVEDRRVHLENKQAAFQELLTMGFVTPPPQQRENRKGRW